jgi:cytochrome P450
MRSQYDERIVNISLNYHRAHSAAKLKLRSSHPALRRINSYFIAEIRDLRHQLREATAILSPVLARARAQLTTDDSSNDKNKNNRNNNFITWLLYEVSPRQFANDSYLINILLAYAISFVFSPTPIGTQIVYEMAFRPESCAKLRRDTEAVFNSDQKRSYDKNALRRLTKLDSFCKETHRHHPSAACK